MEVETLISFKSKTSMKEELNLKGGRGIGNWIGKRKSIKSLKEHERYSHSLSFTLFYGVHDIMKDHYDGHYSLIKILQGNRRA